MVLLLTQTIRIIQLTNLAMQKPNIIALMMNLWPLLLLIWNIVMFAMAPRMNRTMNTTVMGTSRSTVGSPPREANCEGYGPC